MISANLKSIKTLTLNELRQQKKICTFFGVAYLVIAICCFLFPIVSGVFITLFVGWLFVFSGVFQCISTFFVKQSLELWSLIANIILGVVCICIGCVFLANPEIALSFLAIMIGVLFMFSAVMRGVMIFSQKLHLQNKWLNAILMALEFILAMMIFSNNTFIGDAYLISTLLGIQLIFSSVNYFWVGGFLKQYIAEGQTHSPVLNHE